MKKSLSYLLALSLAVPGVLAAPTVKSGLTGFANGMKALFKGNTGAFIDGLLAAAPIIGLFVVVFGLIFFLLKITLFKDDAHSKYARMIGIGIGLIGIAQQSVFDAILNWSTTFLILSFILAIIFMFIIFLNYNRKSHYEMGKSMFNAQGEFLAAKSDARKAKREFNKVEHELGLDEKLYAKTERDLNMLDSDLRDITKLYGDELRQCDHLAELLRKAAAAANRGEDNQVHGYVQALSRDLGGLVTTMQHENADDRKAHELLNYIRKNLAYSFKDEKEALSEEDHIKKIIARHIQHHHELHNYGKDKLAALEDNLYKEGTDMHKHLLAIRSAAIQLKNLEDRIEKHMEEMEHYGYQPKHDAASAVRDAAMTQDFLESHKQLDHLRSLIEHGRQHATRIGSLEQEMRQLVSQIDNHERALMILIADSKATFEKELGADKKSVSVEKKFLKKWQGHDKEIEYLLSQLLSTHKNKPHEAHFKANKGFYDGFESNVKRLLSSVPRSGDADKILAAYEPVFKKISELATEFDKHHMPQGLPKNANYALLIKAEAEGALKDLKK